MSSQATGIASDKNTSLMVISNHYVIGATEEFPSATLIAAGF